MTTDQRGAAMLKTDTRQANWRRANPGRYDAHLAVQRALKAGELEKQTCEVCGAEAVDAHHDRYDEPLRVRWLCRRHVLYELRGRDGFDDKHPDEHREGHIPLLLLQGENPVGAVRLDLDSEVQCVVRLVAILPDHQRRGLGRAMMAALEQLALEEGIRRLEVHPAPDAVPFSQKLGWAVVAGADHPLMAKELPHCLSRP